MSKSKRSDSDPEDAGGNPTVTQLVTRHLRYGWWSLLLFVCLGIFLESLHGFKVAWFLDVGTEPRRLMWRLAHAHGTFLSLVHIAYAVTLHAKPGFAFATPFVSAALMGASILMPVGFFLGGTVIYGGDPGVGIVLLPMGAGLLVSALLFGAVGAVRKPRNAD
jgi:hypothetical protein